MSPLELQLLNDFQRDFPLCPRPFATVAVQLGTTEKSVLTTLRQFIADGTVSRVGPTFRPHSIGVSTLAALAVPEDRLAITAAWINRFSEINHNYEREHHFNLWFVATAPDHQWLDGLLDAIRQQTVYPLLVLPLLESYHINLGFDLCHGYKPGSIRFTEEKPAVRLRLNDDERRLVAILQTGLPLVSRPYAALAEQTGDSEQQVIAILRDWLEAGVIRRLGVIVRHHELGFTANAMTVWDVPDEVVAEYGRRVGAQDGVTLCYRRSRCLPDWPYNLFCMIHGRRREEVLVRIAALSPACGLSSFPHAILFSRRRFKQQSAVYVPVQEAA